MRLVTDPLLLGMMIMLAAFAVVAIVFTLCLCLIRWRSVRQQRPFECEVCGDSLTEKAARHLVAVHDNNDINEQGGWSMTATYCRRHFPA